MPMIPWSEIVTSRILPAGFYNLKIKSADLVNNSYDGCLQINLELRVEQPEAVKGKAHYEFLKLGQVGKQIAEDKGSAEWRERMAIDDPNFEDPRVQQNSKELKTFKRIMECAGYQFPPAALLEEVVAMATDHVFTAELGVAVVEYGKRAGEEKNVINSILPYGSEEPRLGLEVAKAKSSVPKPVAPRPLSTAVRPKPIMTPQIEEPVMNGFFDDEDE